MSIEERIRELWPAVENLRGYQTWIGNGERDEMRQWHFSAHIEGILDQLRDLLEVLCPAGGEHVLARDGDYCSECGAERPKLGRQAP